jgi:hypothetical protein
MTTPTTDAYIPSGEVAQAVARTLIEMTARQNMQRGNLNVYVGEMQADGTVSLTIVAAPEYFDIRASIDDQISITGILWIEDYAYTPLRIWYAFDAQEHTIAENNTVVGPPAAFWMKYGREDA